MGRYYDMVKANYNKLRNDDNVMRGRVEIMDKHLERMMESHPEEYWAIMRDTHELMHGKHFDPEYAEWQVSEMYHKDKEGHTYHGEHWSMEQTTSVMSKYRPMLAAEITPCDFYVALNSQWHDYHCWMTEHFDSEEEIDIAIIESAVKFWFKDDDWEGNGKVWEYFRMRNK